MHKNIWFNNGDYTTLWGWDEKVKGIKETDVTVAPGNHYQMDQKTEWESQHVVITTILNQSNLDSGKYFVEDGADEYLVTRISPVYDMDVVWRILNIETLETVEVHEILVERAVDKFFNSEKE